MPKSRFPMEDRRRTIVELADDSCFHVEIEYFALLLTTTANRDFSKLIPYTTLLVFDAWTSTTLILMTQILKNPSKERTVLGFGFDPCVEKHRKLGRGDR
jgi:hypothetical protein